MNTKLFSEFDGENNTEQIKSLLPKYEFFQSDDHSTVLERLERYRETKQELNDSPDFAEKMLNILKDIKSSWADKYAAILATKEIINNIEFQKKIFLEAVEDREYRSKGVGEYAIQAVYESEEIIKDEKFLKKFVLEAVDSIHWEEIEWGFRLAAKIKDQKFKLNLFWDQVKPEDDCNCPPWDDEDNIMSGFRPFVVLLAKGVEDDEVKQIVRETLLEDLENNSRYGAFVMEVVVKMDDKELLRDVFEHALYFQSATTRYPTIKLAMEREDAGIQSTAKQYLMNDLNHDDEYRFERIKLAIEEIDDEEIKTKAKQVLMTYLDNDYQSTRYSAIELMIEFKEQIKNSEVWDHVKEILNTDINAKDEKTRYAAIEFVQKIKDQIEGDSSTIWTQAKESLIKDLEHFLQSSDAYPSFSTTRKQLIKLAQKIKDKTVYDKMKEVFLRYLDDTRDRFFRRFLVEQVGGIDDPEFVNKFLFKALDDEEWYVQQPAAELAQKVKDTTVQDKMRQVVASHFTNFETCSTSLAGDEGCFEGRTTTQKVDLFRFLIWQKAFESHQVWADLGFDYIPVQPIFDFKILDHSIVEVTTPVLDSSAQRAGVSHNPKFNSVLRRIIYKILNEGYYFTNDIGKWFAPHRLSHVDVYFKRKVDGQQDISEIPRQYIAF